MAAIPETLIGFSPGKEYEKENETKRGWINRVHVRFELRGTLVRSYIYIC